MTSRVNARHYLLVFCLPWLDYKLPNGLFYMVYVALPHEQYLKYSINICWMSSDEDPTCLCRTHGANPQWCKPRWEDAFNYNIMFGLWGQLLEERSLDSGWDDLNWIPALLFISCINLAGNYLTLFPQLWNSNLQGRQMCWCTWKGRGQCWSVIVVP